MRRFFAFKSLFVFWARYLSAVVASAVLLLILTGCGGNATIITQASSGKSPVASTATAPPMTFTNAGNYTYLVPIGVTTLKLQAWGGGGRSGIPHGATSELRPDCRSCGSMTCAIQSSLNSQRLVFPITSWNQ
jgi:hypothetical protein